MKKKNIITAGAMSLAAIALATGFAMSAYAQTPDVSTTDLGLKANRQFAFHQVNNLTDAQKAEMEVKRTEMDADREIKRAAMQTAINSGNYDTWVTAVKTQMGEDAPILEKVTADNFAQFVEAHQLMTQAQEKLQAIGLDRGMGMGEGFGEGHGMKKGMGRGAGFNHNLSNSNPTLK